MKEQTSAVHYAIALLLGVIGLLIILIFVSLRSQVALVPAIDEFPKSDDAAVVEMQYPEQRDGGINEMMEINEMMISTTSVQGVIGDDMVIVTSSVKEEVNSN